MLIRLLKLTSFHCISSHIAIQSTERKRVLLQVCRLSHLSVCLCVWKAYCGKNGRLDPDAIWDGEWGWLREGCIRLY